MSFLAEFSEPSDLLLKLLREASRITFSRDTEDRADFVFNFSITAHALRDWCIKKQSISGEADKKEVHQEWNKHDCLVIARDIANSTKHFGINRYTPQVNGVEQSTESYITLPLDSSLEANIKHLRDNPDSRRAIEQQKPSYIISLEGDKQVTLSDYLLRTISYWMTYFDVHGIPKSSYMKLGNIHLKREFWQ